MSKLAIIKTKIKEALSQAVAHLAFSKVIFISTFIAFLLASINAYVSEDILEELVFAFLMAANFALPVTLLTRNFSIIKKYLLQTGAAAAGFLLGFFSHRGFGNSVFNELYYFGIFCAIVLISLYLFIPKEKSRTYFSLVFKYLLFTAFMTLILIGGICLLIFAVQNLILGTDASEIYECCLYFCTFVFGINTFTYYLFNRRQDESSGKAFKVITLYILFPVFSLLLLILYIYLIKAIVLLKLPSGQINWFVSFASCFYIVFYFILREYDELPAIKFFYRFGALTFVPLIIIQLYAYFVRVNAYGFTGYRYSSLLFIIFSIVTISLTFIKKGKYVNWSILFLTAIVLFDTLSPFNLIKMAHKSQLSRMVKVMNKYDIYDAEKATLKNYDHQVLEQTISDEDRAALYSSYRYVIYISSIPQPEWAMRIEWEDGKKSFYRRDFEDVFGIKRKRSDEKMQSFEKSFILRDVINIEDFKEFQPISDNMRSYNYHAEGDKEYGNEISEIVFTAKNGKKYNLEAFFLSLDENIDTDQPLWYMPDDETAFCFTNVNYDFNKDRRLFKYCNYYGFVFYR